MYTFIHNIVYVRFALIILFLLFAFAFLYQNSKFANFINSLEQQKIYNFYFALKINQSTLKFTNSQNVQTKLEEEINRNKQRANKKKT